MTKRTPVYRFDASNNVQYTFDRVWRYWNIDEQLTCSTDALCRKYPEEIKHIVAVLERYYADQTPKKRVVHVGDRYFTVAKSGGIYWDTDHATEDRVRESALEDEDFTAEQVRVMYDLLHNPMERQ